MRKVSISTQVEDFLRDLPPEPKHAVRLAIAGLAEGDANTRALRDELTGYRRLAVGKYRVIYEEVAGGVDCVHAGTRKTVYQEFRG